MERGESEMYQALYRKWRPKTFSDVIGQQHITDTLRVQLQNNRLSHAYLFTGTRGTGKTSCAKILARAVNCENLHDGNPCNECASCKGILEGSITDVTEIDAASNNGVDNIRELRDETRYTPAQVKKRVFIIDEVHMLSVGAFNALLKTLEEPPSHVLFILATTEIHKVPATILSRCQRFDFRRIGTEDIARKLLDIAANEKITLTEEAAKMLARLSDGAMRDALSMLDRAAVAGVVDEEALASALGILGNTDALDLAKHIKENELAEGISLIGNYYREGRDLAGVYDQLLGLIRDTLLVKTAKSDVSALISPNYTVKSLEKFCDGLASSTLIAWSRIIGEALDRMRNASNRRIEAELCMVRLCSLNAADFDTLDGRVEAIEEKIKNGIAVAAPRVQENQKNAVNMANTVSEKEEPEKITSEEQPEEKAAKKEAPSLAEWPLWPKLLEALAGKINTGAHVNIKLSANGVLENGALVIQCEDEITQTLVKAEPTIKTIREQAEIVNGAPIKIKVRLGEEQDEAAVNHKIDEILNRAKAFDIEVREL